MPTRPITGNVSSTQASRLAAPDSDTNASALGADIKNISNAASGEYPATNDIGRRASDPHPMGEKKTTSGFMTSLKKAFSLGSVKSENERLIKKNPYLKMFANLDIPAKLENLNAGMTLDAQLSMIADVVLDHQLQLMSSTSAEAGTANEPALLETAFLNHYLNATSKAVDKRLEQTLTENPTQGKVLLEHKKEIKSALMDSLVSDQTYRTHMDKSANADKPLAEAPVERDLQTSVFWLDNALTSSLFSAVKVFGEHLMPEFPFGMPAAEKNTKRQEFYTELENITLSTIDSKHQKVQPEHQLTTPDGQLLSSALITQALDKAIAPYLSA